MGVPEDLGAFVRVAELLHWGVGVMVVIWFVQTTNFCRLVCTNL